MQLPGEDAAYSNIIKEDEFPATEMSPDSHIHVFHSGAFQPPTTLLKCFNPPHACSAVEAKEVKEHTIDLLFHLKVEWQIYVLKTSEQILVLVHKWPPRLH